MIDVVQGWALNGNAAAQHCAAMAGEVFLIGWAFGDVVELASPTMAKPTLSAPAFSFPTFANPTLEI